jgi:purine-binding chemotaxis protein CheW
MIFFQCLGIWSKEAPMGNRVYVIIFTLNGKLFGIPVEMVSYVHQAAAILELEEAPDTVPGLVDIHGTPMPLVDMRKKCGLEAKALSPDDFFIEMTVAGRHFALWVDDVLEVVDLDEDAFIDPKELLPGIIMVERIAPHAKGMAVMYDVKRFFAPEYSLNIKAR